MPRQSTAARPSLRSLRQVWAADIGDYVTDLSFSPDDTRVLACAAGGAVSCFDALEGGLVKSWHAHDLGALVAKWSSDGTMVATGGQDGKAVILDSKAFTVLSTLDHSAAWIEHLSWHPRLNVLLTAAGKVARLWNSDGRLVMEYVAHESTVTGLQWNSNLTDAFATSCYGGVRLWHREKPEPTRHLRWKGSLLSLAYAPNSKVVACGCQDGAVHFWMLPSGKDLEMSGYPTKVRELAWDHQSRYLATGGGEDIAVWDFAGKGPEGSTPIMLAGHESFVTQLAFQPGSALLASGGFDGRLFLFQPTKSKQAVAYTELDAEISKLCWRHDGNVLVSGDSAGRVQLWQID